MNYFESMPNIKEVFELKVSLSAWHWTGASQHSRHHVITPGRQTAGILSLSMSRTGETFLPFIGLQIILRQWTRTDMTLILDNDIFGHFNC